jgi:hypothetical protein
MIMGSKARMTQRERLAYKQERIDQLAAQVKNFQAERDEALAALRLLLPWAEAYPTRTGIESSSRRADVEIARAAIARAGQEGGK